MFYGHTQASEEDLKNLSKVLGIPEETLRKTELLGFPDRGRSLEMPPREPLVYRLYEIVQNYGYAYKSVINEKFGDGIMSAISFSTKVEKETDDKGDWVKITLRGKWCVYLDDTLGGSRLTVFVGFPSLDSNRSFSVRMYQLKRVHFLSHICHCYKPTLRPVGPPSKHSPCTILLAT